MGLIDRQAAIEALKGCEFCHYMEFGEYIGEDAREVRLIRAEKAQDAIQNLPSAQPEPCEDMVSRQKLLSDLKELVAVWKKYPVMAEKIKGVETAIGYVKAIPSAQPEIIRCKDCKWYAIWQLKSDYTDDKRYKPSVCVHGRYAAHRSEDWYCADAERRTDEAD